MLGKLIKHDLKWILKLILIYCFLGIFFAVTGRLFGLIENSMFFDIISKICNGISIAMLINAIVNAVIRGWVRVIYNLYKDESYLTHTLPIEKNTQFLAKVLSILITMLIAIEVFKESVMIFNEVFKNSIVSLLKYIIINPIIVTPTAINIVIKIDNTLDKNWVLFLIGNVWVKYDSSLYKL